MKWFLILLLAVSCSSDVEDETKRTILQCRVWKLEDCSKNICEFGVLSKTIEKETDQGTYLITYVCRRKNDTTNQ